MLTKQQIDIFQSEGFLAFPNLLNSSQVAWYSDQYNQILEMTKKNYALRSDLSGEISKVQSVEKITQIMLPSKLLPELSQSVVYRKGLEISKSLYGEDMILDFDMLINKPPNTQSPTPWHQDEAYWIDLNDKRALSIWVAIDNVQIENGCMWYIPKSHLKKIRKHFQKKTNGPLQCIGSEEEALPVPLNPGDCVMHQGRTIHYSRGNTTSNSRRAYILNYRPKSMVALERAQGFDHTGVKKNRRNQ